MIGARIAEEAQLLAEEKWLVDTIKKIKNQRNALQVSVCPFDLINPLILTPYDRLPQR